MSHTSILDRWADQVERRATAPALATAERVWSHQELAGLAAGLRDRLATGTGPVLVACADPVPVVAAILACAATGRPFAPVDTRQPAARWTALLEDLRPGTVLADAAGRSALAAAGPGPTVSGQHLTVAGQGELPLLATESITPLPWAADDWIGISGPDAGYVYFTSGTTGRPKGIRGSFEAVAHFLDWEIAEFGIAPGTRISMLTSPGFDAFLRDALVPLCAGGTAVLPAPGAIPVGAALARWLTEQQVDLLHCVPTVFRTLRAAGLAADSLPRLRSVLMAGEPVRPADIAWWRGLFGDGKELVNLYGPSETTMTKVFRRLTAEDAEAETVPAGHPMPGVEIGVLVGGRPVVDAIGEIEIRTPFPLRGYLGDAAGGFVAPDRYRTGDLGRLGADGTLEVLGRRDQQVKVNGARVELGEIEDLLRRHPAVADVCAALVEEADGEPVLCAYLVADGATDEELRAHAAEGLPAAARPALYLRLAAIPRTLSGKADRRALPSPAAALAGRTGEQPLDGLEAGIAELWRELLHVPAVGRHDDFALLGGDSLGIARLLDGLRTRFGVEVPLRVYVGDPTVAGLAAAVAAGRADASPEGGRR
ncbi:non-ribosomal peptide synthetase [Kitasatospora sp. NPDC086801]|uniref:non-ribosomal peptide synthetase n=1 Tax=Kitasatospora sp. NPDC086801 TaxID=3364066 RepID=UPI00380D24BB